LIAVLTNRKEALCSLLFLEIIYPSISLKLCEDQSGTLHICTQILYIVLSYLIFCIF